MWKKRRRNKIIKDIKIEKVGYGWVGIVNIPNEKKIIVTGGVLPGMIVDIKIDRNRKDYRKWRVLRVKNSKDFVHENLCPHHMMNNNWEDSPTNGCGGCKWQVLPYDRQLEIKDEIIKDSFFHTNIWFEDKYTWIQAAPLIDGYRNKIEFSFGKYITKVEQSRSENEDMGKKKFDLNRLSDWSLGFHKQGMFSKVVDVKNCKFISDKSNKIFSYIKKIIKNSELPVYDVFRHTGFFRHLVIREWFHTGQTLVNLAIAPKYFEENKEKINKWLKLEESIMSDKYLKKNITSFVITENNWLADVVRGKDIVSKNLWWWGYIYESLKVQKAKSSKVEIQKFKDTEIQTTKGQQHNIIQEGEEIKIDFRVSAFSFFQTNTLGAEKLFTLAKNMLPSFQWDILDMYCGAGTIWLTFLKLWIGDNLVWVEIVEDAIIDAKKNADINWLSARCKFFVESSENADYFDKNTKLIIIDPPRSWLHSNLIEKMSWFRKNNHFNILYISCNPVTMARDLQMLQDAWFIIKKLQWMDMFPHTHHVEMIGLLSS